jgi:hypothetical protein
MKTKIRKIVVIVMILFFAGTLSIFGSELNARWNKRVENHFYSYGETKSGTDKSMMCFYSKKLEQFQIRDVESFRVIYQGVSEEYPYLLDNCIVTIERNDDADNRYIFTDFKGQILDIDHFHRMRHIVWDEDPIYISIDFGIDEKQGYIKAIQNDAVLWERVCTRVFDNNNPNYPIWIRTEDSTEMIDPRTGETLFKLEQLANLVVINNQVTVLLTFGNNSENSQIEYVIIDNTEKQICYSLPKYKTDIYNAVHLDNENIFLFEFQEVDDVDFLQYRVIGMNIHDGKFLDRILTINDMASFGLRHRAIWKSDVNGFNLAYFNMKKSCIQIIDLRTDNVIWESELSDYIYNIGYFGDLLYFRTDSFISCLDTKVLKYQYQISIAYTTDPNIKQHDGLEYFAYLFPTKSKDTKNVVIKVQDLGTNELEPYEYSINNINSNDHLVPTKYGVLHVPKFIQSSRISLYKPGITEPFYQTDTILQTDASIANKTEIIKDSTFLKIACSHNHNRPTPIEEYVYIFLDIKEGRVYSQSSFDRLIQEKEEY